MEFKIGDIVVVKKGIKASTSKYMSYEEGDVGVIVDDRYYNVIGVTFNKTSKFNYNRINYSVDRSEIELDKVCKTKLWKVLNEV